MCALKMTLAVRYTPYTVYLCFTESYTRLPRAARGLARGAAGGARGGAIARESAREEWHISYRPNGTSWNTKRTCDDGSDV